MAAVVVVAAAAALSWSAMQTSAATSVNFSAGSLIIPMDSAALLPNGTPIDVR